MDFNTIDEDWSRISFALEPESPDELRVDMFVKKSQSTANEQGDEHGEQKRYDIGWAKEFTGENSCSFHALDHVAKETGLDFTLLGITGDLSEIYFLENQDHRAVVFLHTISRFWAMKNGLLQKVQNTQESLQNTLNEPIAPNDGERTEKLEKKIKKLEKMTTALMKQNKTIYKTIKNQAPKSFLGQLLNK